MDRDLIHYFTDSDSQNHFLTRHREADLRWRATLSALACRQGWTPAAPSLHHNWAPQKNPLSRSKKILQCKSASGSWFPAKFRKWDMFLLKGAKLFFFYVFFFSVFIQDFAGASRRKGGAALPNIWCCRGGWPCQLHLLRGKSHREAQWKCFPA